MNRPPGTSTRLTCKADREATGEESISRFSKVSIAPDALPDATLHPIAQGSPWQEWASFSAPTDFMGVGLYSTQEGAWE